MATNGTSPTTHRVALLGNEKNFWLYSSQTGFDLTHPPKPSSPPILPRITLATTSPNKITIDPAKSALVIIDMQNFFLSPAFGRKLGGAGHQASDNLIQHAIPAARKAGMRIVWLNWGLTQREIDELPPAIIRCFGFEADVGGGKVLVDRHGHPREESSGSADGKGEMPEKRFRFIGDDCGTLFDSVSGRKVEAGKLHMRDQWNTGLFSPLDAAFEEGRKLDSKPDVWIHKNRMSGLAGARSECEEFLEREGIRTLLFTGVNTDQCVGGTLQDAFSKGYDCILLKDGCGTTSPGYAQQCMEFNSSNSWGFSATCKDFADGVDHMKQ